MKCRNCPLFDYDAMGEEGCWLLNDDSELKYEDNHGEKIGCYVQKWFIMQKAKQLKEQQQRLAVKGLNQNESFSSL